LASYFEDSSATISAVLLNRLRNMVIIWILKQPTLIPKMNQLMK
ncbi:Uncharacterized protein APZ42_004654, partial [Daphnia magna]